MLSDALQNTISCFEQELQDTYLSAQDNGATDVVIIIEAVAKKLRWLDRTEFIERMPVSLRSGKLIHAISEPVDFGFWLIVFLPGEIGVIRMVEGYMTRGGDA